MIFPRKSQHKEEMGACFNKELMIEDVSCNKDYWKQKSEGHYEEKEFL